VTVSNLINALETLLAQKRCKPDTEVFFDTESGVSRVDDVVVYGQETPQVVITS